MTDPRDTDPTSGGWNWPCLASMGLSLLFWLMVAMLIIRAVR